MEDAHTAVLNLLEDNPKAAKEHASQLSFFGVFDGHGGSNVALFAGENIHHIVAKQDTFKTGNYEQALKDGFLATDRAILNGMVPPGRPGGRTRGGRASSVFATGPPAPAGIFPCHRGNSR
jgi:serine/threonine protein phosphatase PrpC